MSYAFEWNVPFKKALAQGRLISIQPCNKRNCNALMVDVVGHLQFSSFCRKQPPKIESLAQLLMSLGFFFIDAIFLYACSLVF